MANIRDIAKMAGVSVTTVSRVINGHKYVSEEKRNAVWGAIKKNHYRPNINAVHLSRGKTQLIGVVIPFANHPYFGVLVEGMTNEAIQSDYHLVLVQTNYEEERELEALKMLENRQIDALIICSRQCSWETIHSYKEYGPIILCEDSRSKGISSTFVDHYETFMLALEYLYDHGHRDIGYCIGRRSGTNSQQRERAYRDFLKQHSLPFNEEFIFSNCYHLENGEVVVEELTKKKKRPTALVITSDQVAAGVMTCFQEKGLSVPDDLAIIGFDNQPIAKVMHLTTIEIPLIQLGQKLFKQAIQPQGIPTFEQVTAKLIERKTV